MINSPSCWNVALLIKGSMFACNQLSLDQECHVPARRAVDHPVRRVGQRPHQRWRAGGVGGSEPEGEAGLSIDHFLPAPEHPAARSEEHTSELQSQSNLVCRLLLGKT